ncbi:MAG: AraC family transcriptional regulator [Chitinispirillaceae bacterium]|nr:AraC family transcriptional regulator [Chitinispirillaceae bacterium]MBN2771415.1 AraC family transcriptional regulator [Spirochaetota bacterium]
MLNQYISIANDLTIAMTIAYSIVLLIVNIRIKLHHSFIYISLAIFFLSIFSYEWGMNNISNSTDLFFREHIKLIFFFISMFALSKALKLMGMNKIILKIGEIFFLIFTLLFIISIFFNRGIFIAKTNDGLITTVIFKAILFPSLCLIFFAVFYDMTRQIKKASPFNRRILKKMIYGIAFLILFGISDMVYFIIVGQNRQTIQNFSKFGVLIFSIYTLTFITEIIVSNIKKKKILYLNSNPLKITTNDKDQSLYEHIVNAIIEERLYLIPEMDLSQLSACLKMPRNEISRIINRFSGESFKYFINQFRVNELKQLLQNPDNKNVPILHLGLQAGFNSKATLNRAFKQCEGISPQEYIKDE